MTDPTYKVEYNTNKDHYKFESIGPNGKISKIVILSEMESGTYNLGFGDYDLQTETISDKVVSDNGDMVKVLATVISIATQFLSENPMTYVYIKGSSVIRTQLYQRIIRRYYDDLIISHEIYGLVNKSFEPFQKNKSYESFLIRKLF
jgi:hypothetical protein